MALGNNKHRREEQHTATSIIGMPVSSTAKKDCKIDIRIASDKWLMFSEICKADGKTPSQVIREFIDTQIT